MRFPLVVRGGVWRFENGLFCAANAWRFLKQIQRYLPGRWSMRRIDFLQVLRGKFYLRGSCILPHMRRISRLWNGNNISIAEAPGDGDRSRARSVPPRDRLQSGRTEQPPHMMPKWRVRHDRNLL